MPRIARMVIEGEPAVYHVVSRAVLDGYPFGDAEKDLFFQVVRRLGKIYFTEILGICMMGDHFHLLIRMLPATDVPDSEIRQRVERFVDKGNKRALAEAQIPSFAAKWSSLAEFVREVKQGFTRPYNRRHNRRGFLWGERFKSVIVEPGNALVNCLAYIDMNPVRAGLVENPEDYRWNAIGYHVQTGNKDNFLSLDFGLEAFNGLGDRERLRRYRRFLAKHCAPIEENPLEKAQGRGLKPKKTDRFRSRTRYFSDAGIIGSKAFVTKNYHRFKHVFVSKNEKIPKPIAGLDGVYSMKRLTE